MSRNITGTLLNPDGSNAAGAFLLTAKYNTPGTSGVPRQATHTITVAAGAYTDAVELGTYRVTWTPTAGEAVNLGVAVIPDGPDIDLLTLIAESVFPDGTDVNFGSLTTAALTVTGGATLTNIDLSGGNILQTTADGSDNGYVGICGGGGLSSSRGGFAIGYGNEHATAPGQLRLAAGAIAGGDIIFYAGVGGSERMRVDADGNVAIGTSSPNAPLHVAKNVVAAYSANAANSATNFYLAGENEDTTVNNFASLRLRAGTGDAYLAAINKGTNLSDLAIVLDNGGTFEAARFASSGNVGIGTDSPRSSLDVVAAAEDEGIYLSTAAGADIARLHLEGTSGRLRLYSGGVLTTNLETDGGNSYIKSGNVGIGVVPESGWSSLYDVLQLGGSLAMWAEHTAVGFAALSSNVYFDNGQVKAMDTDLNGAALINFLSGEIQFRMSDGPVTGDVAFTTTIAFTVENDGTLRYGVHGPIVAETVTGYITIKDRDGTSRKLAVVS